MAEIIAVTNQKGGVGKTTIAGNTAYEYARAGYKTLMIDADPQGSLSGWMSGKKADIELTDILVEKLDPREGVVECRKNLYMLKTDQKKNSLREFAQSRLSQEPFIFHDLNEALEPHFDVIIYDLSPSSSLLEKYVQASVKDIYVVTKPESFSVDGLEKVIGFMNETIRNFHSKAKIKKIIVNEIDRPIRMHCNYVEYIRKKYSQYEIHLIYKNSLFKYSQENKCFFQELEKPLNENCKTFFDIIGGVLCPHLL